MFGQVVLAAVVSALVVSGQTAGDSNVLAVMMVGRHGDRTSKVMGNTQLTTLGKNQVYQAGTYFRGRYLNPLSPDYIQGADSDYLYNQIYAAAPYLPRFPALISIGCSKADIRWIGTRMSLGIRPRLSCRGFIPLRIQPRQVP